MTPNSWIAKVQTLTKALGALAILLGGCGDAEDLCAAAAKHLEQCAGVSVEVPESCVPERASFVLGIPCSELAGARGAYSSVGFPDTWFDDTFGQDMTGFLGGVDPWDGWDSDGDQYSYGWKKRSKEELEELLEVWTLKWWGYEG